MTRNRPTILDPTIMDLDDAAFADLDDKTRALREEILASRAAVAAAENFRPEIDAFVVRRVANLTALRRARELTQAEVAETLGQRQADISRLEHRANIQLNTLARFIDASGGRLRIVADYGDDQIEIDIDELIDSDT